MPKSSDHRVRNMIPLQTEYEVKGTVLVQQRSPNARIGDG